MNICLGFSLVPNDTNKVTTFPSIELKQAYVNAEISDLSCIQAYYDHQASKTKADRTITAEALAATRYTHYIRWAEKNLPTTKYPPLKPIDDGGYTA